MKTKKKFSVNLPHCFILMLLLMSITITVFTQSNTTDFIVDSLGRKIQIKPYTRIGVLNPAIIKTMQFIGFDASKIVGVDSHSFKQYSSYLNKNTLIIGDFNKPNIEKIILSNLDILLIDKSFDYSSYKDLGTMKIPYFVYTSMPNSYDKIKENLFALCKLLNKEHSFKQLFESSIINYEKKISSISTHFSGKSICIIVWADTKFMCAGKDTFLSILFTRYGFKNVIIDDGWPIIGYENFITLNPEYILVATSFLDNNIFNKSIFSTISAVKNKNIVFFDSAMENQLLQPSFDLWEGFYNILLQYKIKL